MISGLVDVVMKGVLPNVKAVILFDPNSYWSMLLGLVIKCIRVFGRYEKFLPYTMTYLRGVLIGIARRWVVLFLCYDRIPVGGSCFGMLLGCKRNAKCWHIARMTFGGLIKLYKRFRCCR